MDRRIYNFSAGPATLPLAVLQQAQRELLALPGAGMSVLEISHRSSRFRDILEAARQNIHTLLGVPENYQVLFLHGGAMLEFAMIPMNFLGGSADYILTGSWSNKALQEAQRQGTVRVAWDGQAENYSRVPDQGELELDANAVYAHFTSNETIQGVQFAQEPDVADVPLICDASSDFLSRPIPAERYAMIYASAQKNAGTAGVAIVIIRDDLLGLASPNLPSMLDYRVHAQSRSVLNTPPVFAIYIVMLVTRWLLDEVGGLQQMASRNRHKAQLLYNVLDQSQGFYRPHAQPSGRSIMNITWRLPDEALEQLFIHEAEKEGLCELKGHRSVGGLRASLYNAMPTEGVEALRDFMVEFRYRHPA